MDIVAGNRDDIRTMETAQQQVLADLLFDVDRYDLWGRVPLAEAIRQDGEH